MPPSDVAYSHKSHYKATLLRYMSSRVTIKRPTDVTCTQWVTIKPPSDGTCTQGSL